MEEFTVEHHKYRDDITEYFNKGKENSSEKMNSAQKQQSLKIKYPNHFTIPSETESKQEICALCSKSKSKSKSNITTKTAKTNITNKNTIALTKDKNEFYN